MVARRGLIGFGFARIPSKRKPMGAAAGGVGAPILAFQAGHVAGTNPMSWQSTYTNSIEWDGAGNGDKVGARWRVNGGAWTNEVEQALDATALLNQGFQWPLFEAASPFPGSALVEVEEWRSRYVANVLTGTSAYSNDLSDTMAVSAVSWVPETPPAGQNIAFASNSATFNNVNFGVGMGVVMTSSSDRRITGVTVGGTACTLVTESSATDVKHVAIWRINIAAAGLKSVVMTAASTLKHVAICSGTMTPSSQVPSSTATPKAYAYTADPQLCPPTGTIVVPSNGIALCALTSETVVPAITWVAGTGEENVTEGVNSNGVRLATARLRATGQFDLTGLSGGGTAMCAAAWGP